MRNSHIALLVIFLQLSMQDKYWLEFFTANDIKNQGIDNQKALRDEQ